MTKKAFAASCLLVSGIAVACSTLPLPVPPVPVKISWADVGKATAAGYSNPFYAAAMSKLDSLAGTAVGVAVWKANNFQGYFTYSSPLGGASTMFIDKPCGQQAIDGAASGGSTGSMSGGGGGVSGGSGGTIIGGGCYGNCRGTVEVGEPETV